MTHEGPIPVEAPVQARADRRKVRWAYIVLGIALIWLLAAVTPSPYALEKPGPVVDALGTVRVAGDDVPVVAIDGVQTFPASGHLNVLSVSLFGTPDSHASWLEVGIALFDPSTRILPIDEAFPSGLTSAERTHESALMMSQSQYRAVAAALHRLDIPVTSRLSVAGVVAGGPADGVLQAGDVLRAVGGAQTRTVEELRDALGASLGVEDADRPIAITVLRDGAVQQLSVTPRPAEPGGQPLLGIQVVQEYEFPFEVDLTLGDIGGPSAGLIFALAVYDALTPGGLAGDLSISGTGTITADGSVGPIGGLEQKMWGASRAGTDLFLMPLGNCADVPESIPGGMRVAPVETLDEAISAIESKTRGVDPPGLERCEAAAHAASGG